MPNSLGIQLENNEFIELPSSCYCVFVDETGSETMNDKNYPIFGLGGCGVLVEHYLEGLVKPWDRMKAYYFNDPDAALHASEISPKVEGFEQKVEGLNAFFSNGPYARFASIYEVNTGVDEEFDFHAVAIAHLRHQILELSQIWVPSEIVVIFESCERVDSFVFTQFSHIKNAIGKYPNGREVDIPIRTFLAPKSAKLHGLEVADFIVHTAGTTYRTTRTQNGFLPKNRPDFNAIFGDHVDGRLVDVKFVQGMWKGGN